MITAKNTRRDFLKKSTVTAVGTGAVAYFPWTEKAFANSSAVDRPMIGCVGLGGMGTGGGGGRVRGPGLGEPGGSTGGEVVPAEALRREPVSTGMAATRNAP